MKVVFLMKDVNLPDQGILVKFPVSKSPKFHKKKIALEKLTLIKKWTYDYFSEQMDNILDSSTISKLVNDIVPYCGWSFPTSDYEGMSFKIYCLIATLSALINNVLDETVKVECKNDFETKKLLLSVFNSICNKEKCNNDLEIVESLWECLDAEPLVIQIFSITVNVAFMVKNHCGDDFYEKYARPMLFSTFGKIAQINTWKKSVAEDELFSLSKGTYRNFKIMENGRSEMFDVILCLHNVKLPQQFLMDPQVQQLLYICQSMVAIVNDIFGFKTNISDMKTIKGGSHGMLTYKLRNGMNFKNAIDQEITLFDNLLKDFKKLSDSLLKCFQEKADKENEKYVEQFLEILEFCIEGHIFGTCLANRSEIKIDIIFE